MRNSHNVTLHLICCGSLFTFMVLLQVAETEGVIASFMKKLAESRDNASRTEDMAEKTIHALQEQLQSSAQLLSERDKEIQTLQKQVKQLQSQLQQQQQQLQQQQQQMASLPPEIPPHTPHTVTQDSNVETDRLREELLQHTQERSQEREDFAAYVEKLRIQFDAQMAHATQTSETLSAENISLSEKLSRAQDQIQGLTFEIESLQVDIDTQQQNNNRNDNFSVNDPDVMNQISSLNATIVSLQADKARAEEDLQSARD